MKNFAIARRFERPLLLSGPLLAASLVVFFMSVAPGVANRRQEAACLQIARSNLLQSKQILENAWKDEKWRDRTYLLDMRVYLLSTSVDIYCYDFINSRLEGWSKMSPTEIDGAIAAEINSRTNAPLDLYGFQLPEKLTFRIIGVELTASVYTVTGLLQAALWPLLMFWLISLYQTRHRELLLNHRNFDVAHLYPHALNMYPVVSTLSIRSLVRILIISLFAAPATVLFCVGLAPRFFDDFGVLLMVAAGWLVIQLIAVILLEAVLPISRNIYVMHDSDLPARG